MQNETANKRKIAKNNAKITKNNVKTAKKAKKEKQNKKEDRFFSLKNSDEQSLLIHNVMSNKDEISQKEYERLFKIHQKKAKKELAKQLENDKLSKNVIYVRKNIKKETASIQKNNTKRAEKCNKYLKVNDSDYREIYLTIDKFNNNGKKTIVYFCDSFYPCIDGVLSVMENYVRFMSKYYNVVVCAPKHKQKCYKVNDYFVLYSDSVFIKSQGYDLAFPQVDSTFQKYISLLKIDLIHLQSPFNMGSFGLNLAKKRKIPCFITFHSQFKKNFYDTVKNDTIATWLTKVVLGVFNKSTLAITMNPYASGVLKSYGYKKHIEIIPNATNLVRKEFEPEFENKILERHKIDKNKFNMIFVGRFVAVKNVYFLIEVLRDLFKINKDFNYIFLGYGPELEKMKKKCEEYGITSIVKFTGKIDDEDEKAVLLKNSNLMFFPSCYEIDSIVKIEAACYDVPTLCLENTSLSSVMTDNHNGFVCKNDKEDCVQRLDFLIKNADFVKKVGKNANLELYFTWEKPCTKLKELYEQYLKSYHFKNAKKNKNKTAKNV
jgi:glycosyltransferase involved in cell wall biosynthesis